MPEMLCLRLDDNNLEFGYLLGLSVWLPTIVLVYCLLKFLLHHPQKLEIVEHKKLDEAKGQQAVLYRFRQRQKKIQREITSCSKLIPKKEENCAAHGLVDVDLVHFSHRHPLLRFHLRGAEGIRCNMCTIIISGVAYGCDHCHYFLHELCSYIPKTIRHDFHPMHPLTLLPLPSIPQVESEFCCVACGYRHSLFSFYYHCELCKFDIHLECASVKTTLIHKVKYNLDLFTSFPLKSEGAAVLCGVCNQVMNRQSAWLFYNREFDCICHFECAADEEVEVIGDHSFLSEVQRSLILRKSCLDQQL